MKKGSEGRKQRKEAKEGSEGKKRRKEVKVKEGNEDSLAHCPIFASRLQCLHLQGRKVGEHYVYLSILVLFASYGIL